MHPKFNDNYVGRIEFLLSPDEKHDPMSQKARQELWRKVQEMLEHIKRQEKQIEELKKENRKLREENEEREQEAA